MYQNSCYAKPPTLLRHNFHPFYIIILHPFYDITPSYVITPQPYVFAIYSTSMY